MRHIRKNILVCMAVALSIAVAGTAGSSSFAQEPDTRRPALLLPAFDPQVGRQLFVGKGCVLCHAVNGVGGKAAPALDAPIPEEGSAPIDVLGFVSRMWRGAPAMLELQAIELGYQIELSAQELADLAAFAGTAAAQEGFGPHDIPEVMHYWVLDEPYWEEDDWPEELLERELELDQGTL